MNNEKLSMSESKARDVWESLARPQNILAVRHSLESLQPSMSRFAGAHQKGTSWFGICSTCDLFGLRQELSRDLQGHDFLEVLFLHVSFREYVQGDGSFKG